MTEIINGTEICYRIEGEAKDRVLLLHGWGCDMKMMQPVADALKTDHTTLLIDFPGHGESGRPPEPWGVPEYADALLELVSGGWTAYCGESSCSLNAWILHDVICDDPLVNSLVLRDEVGRVEPYVFSDCGLHELRLSQSLESIGYGAFENNPALMKIVVPARVTEVESDAFQGCTSLKTVTCLALEPPVIFTEWPFDNTVTRIEVPAQSLLKYKTTWTQYADIIVGLYQ